MSAPLCLHVGCGEQRLAGWVNIDRQQLPGVDFVADVTRGLPFDGAAALFAEHFLEHLRLDYALAFLQEAHRVLAPGSWLRLSTPNLEWVLATHHPATLAAGQAGLAALHLNRGFHGWSHHFLWNRGLLAEVLESLGFESLRWCRRGESELPLLRGLERHATYPDEPGLPHVLIVEGRRGERREERVAALRARLDPFLRDLRATAHQVDAARSRVRVRLAVTGGPAALLLRTHVVEATRVGGVAVHFPEAPAEGSFSLEVPVAHLRVDAPLSRLALGLRALPEWPRRRVEAALRGAGGLDAERHPLLRLRSTALLPCGRDRVRVRAELCVRDLVVPVEHEAGLVVDESAWRARGSWVLDAGGAGLAARGLDRLLLGKLGEVAVDYDVVALPVGPT